MVRRLLPLAGEPGVPVETAYLQGTTQRTEARSLAEEGVALRVPQRWSVDGISELN
jgi:hypothetical protein